MSDRPVSAILTERIEAFVRRNDGVTLSPNALAFIDDDIEEALRARLLTLENELAQAYAQLQWIGECIEGQDVSEFAESFPLIRAVADLKRDSSRLLTLEQALRALTVKWRTEARDEQRVSFCADELEAALAASRGRDHRNPGIVVGEYEEP